MSPYKDEKGTPFINFKIINAKKIKDGILKKLLRYGISIH